MSDLLIQKALHELQAVEKMRDKRRHEALVVEQSHRERDHLAWAAVYANLAVATELHRLSDALARHDDQDQAQDQAHEDGERSKLGRIR